MATISQTIYSDAFSWMKCFIFWFKFHWSLFLRVHLSLGLQGLYNASNCADNILGRFTIILQNRIARVDSLINLIKKNDYIGFAWMLQFHHITLFPLVSNSMSEAHTQRMHVCRKYHAWILEPGDTFRIGSCEISVACWWGDHFLDVVRCLAI